MRHRGLQRRNCCLPGKKLFHDNPFRLWASYSYLIGSPPLDTTVESIEARKLGHDRPPIPRKKANEQKSSSIHPAALWCHLWGFGGSNPAKRRRRARHELIEEVEDADEKGTAKGGRSVEAQGQEGLPLLRLT